jgi:hypothetical protein
MNPSVMGAEDGESDRNTSLPTGPGPDRGRGRQARRMKIDSIYPLPLRGGRVRVGVNIQILSPLTFTLLDKFAIAPVVQKMLYLTG